MAKERKPIYHLSNYLPTGSLALLLPYITQYQIHITISRERKTILGNYKRKSKNSPHQISVNGNLNAYSFLITFIHEIAHLVAYEKFPRLSSPHGEEWKSTYAQLLISFLGKNFFPENVEHELRKSARNPSASCSGEPGLMRVLMEYDEMPEGTFLVEKLAEGAKFQLENGRVFVRQSQRRKRIVCIELATGRTFLFSPLALVQAV